MGFKLAHVMRAFALYETKPLHKRGASLGALRNLIHSYVPLEDIGDDDTLQILEMLVGQDFGLREMALLVIKQLSARENNAFKFLLHDAFPKLVLLLELETMAEHHESTAFALEQIVSHTALKDWWDEIMKKGGFASIVNHAQPDQPLPVRYACACVLRALAQYQFYATVMINNAMSLITTFKSMNSDFQEVYTAIMSKLMLHADDKTVSLLNTDALPSSLNMLQQGPCAVQQQALMLISSLGDSSAGLQAVLQDSNTVPMVLSALANTECRKTRQNAALAIAKVTSCDDISCQKQFLLHVDKFHHETEDKIEAAGAEGGMKLAEITKEERIDRALSDLGKDLVQLVHKLGKMERDLLGNTVDIHLAPCIDTDTTDLTTLCHVLQILSNLMHFSTNQIRLQAFEEEHSAQRKLIKSIKQSLEVNYKICQILIQQRILCIAELLSVYTQKLLDIISICSKPLKSMNGMSKSQLLFQAWGSQSETMSSAGKVNVTSLFDSNEVDLIIKLLEVLNVLSFSTTPLESDGSSLESRINEQLLNRKHAFTSEKLNCNSKPKKSKKKQFHSKVACELCKKSGKLSEKITEKSGRTKGAMDKILPDTSSKSEYECSHKTPEENESLDRLEESFKSAFGKHIAPQQRHIRIALYEAGVVESVGPWLMSCDTRHQSLVLSILRHMVQPVQEKIAPSPPKQPRLHSVVRTRPAAINMTAKERDQAMDIALYQMSSRMKQFIEEALGRRSNPPPNSPKELSVPNSASDLSSRSNSKFRHPENKFAKVEIVTTPYTEQVRSTSNLADLGDTTYRQEDYDRFARSNSSLNLKSSRPSSGLRRPDSVVSINSASSTKTGSSLRSNSFTRLSSAKGRSRRQSVSPRRNRRPCSAAPTTKPINGYQVVVKSPTENNTISISKSIEKLSSSSSESMGDSREITAENFPSSVYDLDRPRSRLGTSVSDEGHRCSTGTRPRSSLSRGRSRERQHSAVSESAPIGQRYPKRVWVPWKPQLQSTQGVGEQCRCLVAMVIGKVLLQQVFAKDQQLRKEVLDFMDQYIKHGQVDSHMKMSEQGVMPRMVDFLRINEDDVLLEMMGLSVVQKLLKSDTRLVEVFQKHGGTDLLVSMSSSSAGPLRQHVADTLHVVTKADAVPKKRVLSAPARRNGQSDIWDQIMQRWKQEDKVIKNVLQKFNP